MPIRLFSLDRGRLRFLPFRASPSRQEVDTLPDPGQIPPTLGPLLTFGENDFFLYKNFYSFLYSRDNAFIAILIKSN